MVFAVLFARELSYTDLGGMSEEEIGQMGEAWLRSALLTQKYSHDPTALMARFERIHPSPGARRGELSADPDGLFFEARVY